VPRAPLYPLSCRTPSTVSIFCERRRAGEEAIRRSCVRLATPPASTPNHSGRNSARSTGVAVAVRPLWRWNGIVRGAADPRADARGYIACHRNRPTRSGRGESTVASRRRVDHVLALSTKSLGRRIVARLTTFRDGIIPRGGCRLGVASPCQVLACRRGQQSASRHLGSMRLRVDFVEQLGWQGDHRLHVSRHNPSYPSEQRDSRRL